MPSGMRLYLIVGLLFGSVCLARADDTTPASVSVLSIAGDPAKFSKRQVILSGWLLADGVESGAPTFFLFPTTDHWRVRDFPSAIEVESETLKRAFEQADTAKELAAMDGAYVLLTCTFHAFDLTEPGNVGLGFASDVKELRLMIPRAPLAR